MCGNAGLKKKDIIPCINYKPSIKNIFIHYFLYRLSYLK